MSPVGRDAPFVARLAGFVRFLRLRGIPVGTGAALDCGRALREISLLDRDTFRTACLVTMAKSPDDVSRLRDAFDIYWSVYIEPAESESRLAVSAPRSPPPDDGTTVDPALAAMRVGVDRDGAVRVGLYSPDAPSAGHLVPSLERRRILAIRSGVRRLRRQVGTRPGRRRSPSKRGSLDFRATARHSLREGGEWVEFRFRRRKMSRADLMVLWDVSGSMREHEANLFGLVHALHQVVRRTRVFAFGTRLEEVTGVLRGRSYVPASRAISERLGPMGGGTRIGQCLEGFLQRYGRVIRGGTTVVILSDGWDLGETALLANAMRRIHRLAHMVVWVNPYADDPGFEPATAGMRQALPHVDLLLGPRDFEARTSFAPERIVALRPRVRLATRGKAFIASAP